ncbi:hypothetical protein OIO90_002166 [Microbotryomycetes sp. JL221]|nr:hypothetical protein OIO90_002166 [Microbotryomycetes sp. JL221]
MLNRRLTTRLSAWASRGRLLSTCTTVKPSSSAERQLALPLSFITVKGKDDIANWRHWTTRAADRGFESLVIELDSDSGDTTTRQGLAAYESELTKVLRESSGSPFPPVLLASGEATLVAETYVSSHPLSGLFLHEPVLLKGLPRDLEFTYEPLFPVGLLSQSVEQLRQDTRLGLEWYEGDDDGFVALMEGTRDDKGWRQFLSWLDRSGL